MTGFLSQGETQMSNISITTATDHVRGAWIEDCYEILFYPLVFAVTVGGSRYILEFSSGPFSLESDAIAAADLALGVYLSKHGRPSAETLMDSDLWRFCGYVYGSDDYVKGGGELELMDEEERDRYL
jgi:hypothetical protein